MSEMVYYFRKEKRNEFLEKHSMKEYAEFLEISVAFLFQVLNNNRHTKKTLEYALSRYAVISVDYFFEGVE